MFDLLIKNGRVVDGTGQTWFRAGVAVSGDTVQIIRGDTSAVEAAEVIDAGGSVVVIEHNLEFVAAADWIIDLGPEGGAGGGEVIATGTPETVAENPSSYTGQFLNRVLYKRGESTERISA